MELKIDDYIRLVTGKGAWHTNDCGGKLVSLRMSDGPHGLRKQDEGVRENNNSKVSTCFPTASAVACGWDESLAALMGDAIAIEAWNEEVSVLLGPGVNIKRSPLCGRNFEYYSEDPFLAGRIGAAFVNAVQKQGVAASLKHFAGNSQETHRMTSNSQIDERALREIYLSAFEQVVKRAKPATVMASYNLLNGVHACENAHLLTDILRSEWGFEGVVVSDWSACIDLAKCIVAGMDLEMPDSLGIHTKQLKKALEENRITADEIERAGKRISALIDKYAVPHIREKKDGSRSHETARKIERESAVLLKNDGILPIAKGADIVIIGALAEQMRFQGGGSSHINTRETPNALESLRAKGINISYAKGYITEQDEPDEALEKQAQKLAAKGKPVLFFGGLTDISEGEGYDRKTYSMPQNQLRLLKKVSAVNENIAFVSFSGAPYDMSFEDDVRAILQMYLGGEAVGEACAELLTGEANPCGKLAESYPYSITDTPCYWNFASGSDDVEYRESIFTGYRYYDTFNIPVRFPFGFGLSYTSFEYANLSLSTGSYTGGPMSVSFDMKNTGTVAGAEISQLYVNNPDCNYLRANRELRGFAKTFLEPGESRRVTIELEDRAFSVYDTASGGFVMPSGEYEIQISAAVNDCRLKSKLEVKGIGYDRNEREKLSEYFDKKVGIKSITHAQFKKLYGRECSCLDLRGSGEYSVYDSLSRLSRDSRLARSVLKLARVAAYAMCRGKPHNDPEVLMMLEGIREGTLDCVVCQSGGLLPYALAEAIVRSANGKAKNASANHVNRQNMR